MALKMLSHSLMLPYCYLLGIYPAVMILVFSMNNQMSMMIDDAVLINYLIILLMIDCNGLIVAAVEERVVVILSKQLFDPEV